MSALEADLATDHKIIPMQTKFEDKASEMHRESDASSVMPQEAVNPDETIHARKTQLRNGKVKRGNTPGNSINGGEGCNAR